MAHLEDYGRLYQTEFGLLDFTQLNNNGADRYGWTLADYDELEDFSFFQ